jgi:hypothetical protein
MRSMNQQLACFLRCAWCTLLLRRAIPVYPLPGNEYDFLYPAVNWSEGRWQRLLRDCKHSIFRN